MQRVKAQPQAYASGREAFRCYWREEPVEAAPFDDDFARGVVDEFEQIWSELGQARRALERGRAKAGEKHIEPLDALLELLQNADDQGAASARFLLDGGELLFSHDGARIELQDVAAIVMPYLSTKEDDGEKLGRFGIGLKTLTALGPSLSVHCAPYHFVADASGPHSAPERSPIEGFYDPGRPETLFVVGLRQGAVEPQELSDWFEGLGVDGLVFLRNLKTVSVEAGSVRRRLDVKRGSEAAVVGPISGTQLWRSHLIGGGGWDIYWRDLRPPDDLMPTDKGREDAVSVSVAVSNVSPGGRVCIGLPLERRTQANFSINAPFDPDEARRDLRRTDWNDWLFDGLSVLLGDVVALRFAESPSTVWRAVPLESELPPSSEWIGRQFAKQRAAALGVLETRTFAPPDPDEPATTLAEATYEPSWLDGYLEPELLTRTHSRVIPGSLRDGARRWRRIMRDAQLGVELDAVEALDAVSAVDEATDKPAAWWAALVARVVTKGHEDALSTVPVLVLDDGRRVSPREVDAGLVLTLSSADVPVPVLAVLDDGFVSAAAHGGRVLSWLRRTGRLAEEPDDARLLDALAGWSGEALRLSHESLLWLQRGLWSAAEADRERLGRAVGEHVRIDGFRFTDGERTPCTVVVAQAYLPSTITHQRDAFSRVAGHAPGLDWVASRYDHLLRSSDEAIGGALATLRLLGARTVPEPHIPEQRENRRYVGPPAYRFDAEPGSLQRDALRALTRPASALRPDYVCPDLVGVARDVSEEPDDTERHQRASSLFALLRREWATSFAERTESPAVLAYQSWQHVGRVPATWRSQLADIPWMHDADGLPLPPRQLALRTPALLEAHGDEFPYSADADLGPRAEAVAEALGMTTRPVASGLVEELKSLRDRSEGFETSAVERRSWQLLRALALLCPPVPEDDGPIGPDEKVDDLDVRGLRATFGIARARPGLIFADGRWWPPTAAVVGSDTFGRLRVALPTVGALPRLWRVLGVGPPTVETCAQALHELASQPLEAPDAGVHLGLLRLLASLVDDPSSTDLTGLPLWTADGWQTSRPVYSASDPHLAEALKDHVAVWEPACDPTTLGTLPRVLGITELGPDAFEIVGLGEDAVDRGALYSQRIRTALELYLEDCAREGPELYASAAQQRDALGSATVALDPALAVRVRVGREDLTLDVECFVGRSAALLAARDPALFGSKTFGRSLAAAWLANGGEVPAADPVKAALLWAEAWRRAEAGVRASGLAMPTTARTQALQQLADEVNTRDVPPPKRRSRTAPTAGPVRDEPTVVRLKDPTMVTATPATVTPADPEGPAAKPGHRPMRQRSEIETSPGSKRKRGTSPRVPDRRPEDVAMDLLEVALRSGLLRDFRDQRGVGADALDEMLRFIELKHDRRAIPARVTLTRAEFKRAQELGDDFVLAVVAGLETGTTTVVRLYVNPLANLDLQIPSSVTLSGLQEAAYVEIPLVDRPDNPLDRGERR